MSFLTEPLTIPFLRTNKRTFGGITVQVIINESTNDELEITQQPVQQGASITDHAFKKPVVLSMTMLFKGPDLIDTLTGGDTLDVIYKKLVDLQTSRLPFTVSTPKRVYSNMLIRTLGLTTDKNTENSLAISCTFQEVILVSVGTTSVPRSRQGKPSLTGATQNKGNVSALALAAGKT